MSDATTRAADARASQLLAAGDEAGAIAVLEAACTATVDPALAVNLGRLLWRRGDLARAIFLLEGAAEALPGSAAAWLNLADARAAAGDGRAEGAYRRALLAAPDRAEIHWSLALELLVRGEWDRAWPHFAWRGRHPGVRRRPAPFPMLATLARPRGPALIWSNEGVGEDLRYARLLAPLAERLGPLVVEADPRLVPLLARSVPAITVVPRAWPPAPESASRRIVAQATPTDLLALLRPRSDRLPGGPTWLRPEPALAARLRARYRSWGRGPVVGLSWRSSGTPFATAKSIPRALFGRLLAHPDVVFVDLQYGDAEAERAPAPAGAAPRRDPEIDPRRDLDAFAAQVAAMDLVVSSSNTTVHMAGALGVPVWTLIHRGPPVTPYWLVGRADTPWYATMRVWRQPVPGDWTTLMAEVATAFAGWLADRAGAPGAR